MIQTEASKGILIFLCITPHIEGYNHKSRTAPRTSNLGMSIFRLSKGM